MCYYYIVGRYGRLFYEYYRVLMKLRQFNPADRPLFWLFENVASMQQDSRETISRLLVVCYAGPMQ